MYADRVEAGAHSSIRDRLNGNTVDESGRRRVIAGKRQRQDDDKWEHDLYKHDGPRVSNSRVGAGDLRLKLRRKSTQQATEGGKGSISGDVRDLREKLSGTMYSEPVKTAAPPKSKPVVESSKPARKSVIVESSLPETKKVASSVSKRKTQPKVESVDSFLQSLGLEKYSITFQAEEVDMAALLHMTDEDLKAVGVPMGPRKKILLALESRV
ncbi:hypothetical protein RJ640_025414 [Escallonia rubra]|uniref:SAM domain-containing protein n=1 Tax=Escallonia rubra TaxID=112253 RepID=A0AA88RN68_9ASTE|nr:hypothetical protein RJ640_025414 [Escallonia rubra]